MWIANVLRWFFSGWFDDDHPTRSVSVVMIFAFSIFFFVVMFLMAV